MGLADLHLHTTASDGMMSPRMLLNYVAMMTPLDCVAITDHDTLDGWRLARDFRARPANEHLRALDLVPGVEVSTRDGHVLALWVESEIPPGAVEKIRNIEGVICVRLIEAK